MILRNKFRTAALAAALLTLLPVEAFAQSYSSEPAPVDHHRKPSDKKAAAPEVLYPKATRTEPKIVETALQDKLAKLSDQVSKKQNDPAIAGAEAILADPKAKDTDRALAAYYAGFAARDKNSNDYSQTISYFQRAISENGLPNNTHYSIMLSVAQMQLAGQKYAEALATAQRYLTETQSEDVDAYAVVGNSQYRLEHYPEASVALKKVLEGNSETVDKNNLVQMLISCYQLMKKPNEAAALAEQLSAKSPDDKNAQMLVANIYANSDQPEKALAIFNQVRAKGQLTDS